MSVRNAGINDGREFNALVNALGGASLFRAQFGQYNFTSLVEYAHMSLYMPAEDDSCGAFAAFCDGQLNLSDGATFDEILTSLSEIIPCRSTNSLLLNFWALNSNAVGEAAGFDLLRYLYHKCPAVNYVFWLCSETVSPPEFLAAHFSKVNLSKRTTVDADHDPLTKQSVYYIHRSKILPQLQVRDARVEDNDDLLPILQSSNPNIANGQEEYFLANLIQSQNDRSKFFVGVHKNRPVGMLATSLDINADLLARVFDLDAYTGLVCVPEAKVDIRPYVTLMLGEPDAIKKVSVGLVCKQSQTVWVDCDALRRGNPDIQSAADIVVAIQGQIASLSGNHPRGCVITGFPRNEPQARALLSSLHDQRIIVDAVLELQRAEDGIDMDGEDADEAAGDALDAIEMLREPFTGLDGFSEEMGMRFESVTWRKIVVSADGDDVNDVALVELKSLLDAYDDMVEEMKQSNQEGPHTNAFAISLFSMDEKFESRSEDLLRVAFEEYHDYDYCILMVPNSTIPSTALTHGMQCPHVKEGVSFDQSLYLLHRHALLAHDHLEVIRLCEEHLPLVDTVLDALEPALIEKVSGAVKRSMRDKDVELSNNPAEVSFAVTLGQDLVGVVCVSRKVTTSEDITNFRENFQLDDVVSYERHRGRAQAAIIHWVVNPVFSKWTRFIMREIMRHYRKTLLYYFEAKGVKPCSDLMQEMEPVRIRNRAYALPNLVDPNARNNTEEKCTEEKFDMPLFLMLKKNIAHAKSTVSKRIVVVGGNISSFAVIENICMHSAIHVPNIYLVMDSTPSPWKADNEFTPTEEDEPRPEDTYSGCLSPHDVNAYTEQELNALGLPHRVTLIQGKLSDIDRKNRAIIVSDEVIVEYDVLVIASALQDASYKKFPSLSSIHPSSFPEKGIFCLGSYITDELALAHVKQEGLNPSNKSSSTRIAVYGDGVHALTVMGRMQDLGVDPSRILWVTKEENITDFQIDDMLSLVEAGICGEDEDEAGADEGRPTHHAPITVFKNTEILDVECSSHDEDNGDSGRGSIDGILVRRNPLKNSVMGSKDEFITCCTLICCSNLQCDADIFTAINECGLVFDGGVVVNEGFRTMDSHIYACGPFTRYSRRYRGEVEHSRINAKELGEYVGNEIITKHLTLEALGDFDMSPSAILDPYGPDIVKFPKFRTPRIMDCIFPGGIHYFSSTLPDASSASVGPYMATGPTGDLAKRVCAVKIAKLGYLAELVCIQQLTNDTTAYERNIATTIGCLVGWHQCYLNSPAFAFESNTVKDWVEYFSEDWVAALRFDRFPFMADIIRSSLFSDKGMINILDKVMENAESTDDIEAIMLARKNILGDRGDHIDAKTRGVVSSYVIDFIRKNKTYLPQYFIPEPKANKFKK